MTIDALVHGRAFPKFDHAAFVRDSQVGAVQEMRPKIAAQIFARNRPNQKIGRKMSSESLERKAGIFMLGIRHSIPFLS